MIKFDLIFTQIKYEYLSCSKKCSELRLSERVHSWLDLKTVKNK